MAWRCLLVVVLAAAGCSRERSSSAQDAGSRELVQETQGIDTAAPHLRYTFLGKDGKFKMAQKAQEVPPEARGAAMVVDLSQLGGETDLVRVLDLRTPSASGRYLARLMDRPSFERIARRLQEQNRPPVVMYATSWCAVCARARTFLREHGVKYVEHDVEKDLSAASRLREKAAKAGVEAKGVPIFEIGDRILPGFDEGTLKRMLNL
jgi:glutaredoxin